MLLAEDCELEGILFYFNWSIIIIVSFPVADFVRNASNTGMEK